MGEPSPPSSSVAPPGQSWWLPPVAVVRPLPEGYVVERRWGRIGDFFFWSFFFGGGMSRLFQGIRIEGPEPTWGLLALAVVAYGFVFYVAAAIAINRTRVTIQDGVITRTRSPLPWPNARLELRATQIRDLRRIVFNASSRGRSDLAHIEAVTDDGRAHRIFSRLKPADALELEAELEKRLGLKTDAAPVRKRSRRGE